MANDEIFLFPAIMMVANCTLHKMELAVVMGQYICCCTHIKDFRIHRTWFFEQGVWNPILSIGVSTWAEYILQPERSHVRNLRTLLSRTTKQGHGISSYKNAKETIENHLDSLHWRTGSKKWASNFLIFFVTETFQVSKVFLWRRIEIQSNKIWGNMDWLENESDSQDTLR